VLRAGLPRCLAHVARVVVPTLPSCPTQSPTQSPLKGAEYVKHKRQYCNDDEDDDDDDDNNNYTTTTGTTKLTTPGEDAAQRRDGHHRSAT
jgi:hypothetical protein